MRKTRFDWKLKKKKKDWSAGNYPFAAVWCRHHDDRIQRRWGQLGQTGKPQTSIRTQQNFTISVWLRQQNQSTPGGEGGVSVPKPKSSEPPAAGPSAPPPSPPLFGSVTVLLQELDLVPPPVLPGPVFLFPTCLQCICPKTQNTLNILPLLFSPAASSFVLLLGPPPPWSSSFVLLVSCRTDTFVSVVLMRDKRVELSQTFRLFCSCRNL